MPARDPLIISFSASNPSLSSLSLSLSLLILSLSLRRTRNISSRSARENASLARRYTVASRTFSLSVSLSFVAYRFVCSSRTQNHHRPAPFIILAIPCFRFHCLTGLPSYYTALLLIFSRSCFFLSCFAPAQRERGGHNRMPDDVLMCARGLPRAVSRPLLLRPAVSGVARMDC